VKQKLKLAASDSERYCKPGRRETFLAETNSLVQWQVLTSVIQRYYAKLTSADYADAKHSRSTRLCALPKHCRESNLTCWNLRGGGGGEQVLGYDRG
jgi:hypothetical protein